VVIVVDTLFLLGKGGGGRSIQKVRIASDAGNAKYSLSDANCEYMNSIELDWDLSRTFRFSYHKFSYPS
jgi:hypothetical protein